MKHEQKRLKKALRIENNRLDLLLKNPPANIVQIRKSVATIQSLNRQLSSLKKHKTEIQDDRPIHPALREIMAKMSAKMMGDAKCVNCGQPDGGNTVNGVPWCFKCNQPLTTKKAQGITIKAVIGKYPKNLTFSEIV